MGYFSSEECGRHALAHSTTPWSVDVFDDRRHLPLELELLLHHRLDRVELFNAHRLRGVLALMQNGAFSASALGTTRTSLQLPRSMSSTCRRPRAGRWPIGLGQERDRTEGPRRCRLLVRGRRLHGLLELGRPLRLGNVNAMSADSSTLRVHEAPALRIINRCARLQLDAAPAGVQRRHADNR